MNDVQIIELYNLRDQNAIVETERKYGVFCHQIAYALLKIREDAEECVQDTYQAAWDTIPPASPVSLRAFLGRIVRNLSIDRFRKLKAQKRDCGLAVMLSELEECLPSAENTEEAFDRKQLSRCINAWLSALPSADCALFVRRYWYGDSVKMLAKIVGCTAAQMAQRMLRLRKSLKQALEKEGILL